MAAILTVGKNPSGTAASVGIGTDASNSTNLFICALPAQFNSTVYPNSTSISVGTSSNPFGAIYLKDQSGNTTSVCLSVTQVASW